MPLRAPISIHLDLFRYWESKRRGQPMPARSEIDPVEIPHLLPYLTLIEGVEGGGFRYRLVGTEVTQELGRELTGSMVGSYVSPPAYAAAIRGIYERIFASGRPTFSVGEYHSKTRSHHSVSRLMVPLGNDHATVNMVLFTRVSRFRHNVAAATNWLEGASGALRETVEFTTLAEAHEHCLAWERQCATEEAGVPAS